MVGVLRNRGRSIIVGDSHVDSHGGHTPAHPVDPVDGDHAQDGARATLNDPMDAERADF
jgi:hypothetical protein